MVRKYNKKRKGRKWKKDFQIGKSGRRVNSHDQKGRPINKATYQYSKGKVTKRIEVVRKLNPSRIKGGYERPPKKRFSGKKVSSKSRKKFSPKN